MIVLCELFITWKKIHFYSKKDDFLFGGGGGRFSDYKRVTLATSVNWLFGFYSFCQSKCANSKYTFKKSLKITSLFLQPSLCIFYRSNLESHVVLKEFPPTLNLGATRYKTKYGRRHWSKCAGVNESFYLFSMYLKI